MKVPLMSRDRIESVQRDVDEVRQIVITNIDRIVERGERVDALVEKSENLANEAKQFKSRSKALKQKMCFQNAKLTLVCVGIVLAIGAIIAVAVCATGNCRR